MIEITFADDAEREFWDRTFNRLVLRESYFHAAGQADQAVIQRRKRIGPKPQPEATARLEADELPREVRKVLEVNVACLNAAASALLLHDKPMAATFISELRLSILAARAALGMETQTKEQKP